jgi:predicted TIM-barrel fold metal-dependent hydrolase
MAPPRRIDVHFHLIPPFYREAVYAAGRGPAIGRYPEWTPQLALELMDAHGIEVALTSLAQPGVGFASGASAQALARRCNDYAAELIARWPKRFGAFGTVPMWSIEGALDAIAYSLDTLKFAGVSLFASYGEDFLGDARFDPLLAALDERGAVVFVHPGLVPYFAWRLSVSPMIDPRLPRLSRDEVYAGLKHFWYDNALSPGEQTFGALDHVALPERIVFGTDYPFANPRVIAEMIKTYESGFLSGARRAEIDRANALALFPNYG